MISRLPRAIGRRPALDLLCRAIAIVVLGFAIIVVLPLMATAAG
jgi:hypothetical protein